jgi:hypothetical protein
MLRTKVLAMYVDIQYTGLLSSSLRSSHTRTWLSWTICFRNLLPISMLDRRFKPGRDFCLGDGRLRSPLSPSAAPS